MPENVHALSGPCLYYICVSRVYTQGVIPTCYAFADGAGFYSSSLPVLVRMHQIWPQALPFPDPAFADNADDPGFIAPTFGGNTSRLPSFLFQKSTSTMAVLAGRSSWMK